ncbi:MAG: choice-of-anchor Q domain-containing protein [Pseudomonadota bacterium]
MSKPTIAPLIWRRKKLLVQAATSLLPALFALAALSIAGSVQAAQLIYPGPAPCDTTLQACISAAAEGDTIDIATNTPIDEQLFIGRTLRLRPAPGFTPVIGGGETTRGIDFGGLGQTGISGDNQRVIVEDLTFDNARLTGVVRFGTGHELLLRNNRMTFQLDNNNSGAVDLRLEVPTTTVIERNHIASTGQGVRVQSEGDATTVDFFDNVVTTSLPEQSNSGLSYRIIGTGTHNLRAYGNVIYSVAGCSCGNASGIQLRIEDAAEVDADFQHNTMHDIQGTGDGIDVFIIDPGASVSLAIINNTVSEARQSGYRILPEGAASSLLVLDNNSFNNGQPDVGLEGSAADGVLAIDPHFVDVARANFRLRKESSLIDRGASGDGSFRLDADGATRRIGGGPDIGAYEFDAEAPLLITRREVFEGAPAGFVVSDPYPNNSSPGEPFVSGGVTLSAVAPSSLNFSNWPADFPGDNNIELAINDAENLVIQAIGQSVRGLGIEFDDASGGSSPSTFDAVMFLLGREVGTLSFRTPNPSVDNFVGIWTPIVFDTLRILESPNANENEFFGRVFFTQVGATSKLFSDSLEELCPLDDGWEPNDSLAAPTVILTPFERDSFVSCGGNDDFFRFTAEENEVVFLTATFDHAGGNIDFELLDPSGAVVARGDSTTNNESVNYLVPPGEGGEYTLRVFGVGDIQNRYMLEIDSA